MAVAVLSTVLVTVGLLIPRSVLHLRNKGWDVLAAQMAQQIIEGARGLDSADIPSGDWDGTRAPLRDGKLRQFPPPPYPSQTATIKVDDQSQSATFRFTVKIAAAVRPGAPETVRRIVVTASWVEPNGSGEDETRTYALASNLGP